MTTIAELAIRINSTDVPRAANDMDRVTVAGARMEGSVKRATASAERLGAAVGSTARGGLTELSSRAGVAGNALAGFGAAGLAAAAALGAVAVALQATRKALAFGDEIADQAAKLAVSTKALQEYRYAVHALGGDFKDADAALAGFQTTFGLAAAGFSKRATKPFEALGLDAASFKSSEDALAAVIDKIANLESTAEQAAIAEKLGIGAMLPAIRAGATEIDRLREAANRLGFVMDDAMLQKASAANDELEAMGVVIGVQLSSALVDLAPILLAIANGFADAARFAAGFAQKLGEVATWANDNGLAKLLGWLANSIPGLGQISNLMGAMGAGQGGGSTKGASAAQIAAGRGGLAALMAAPRARTGRLINFNEDEDGGSAGADTAAAKAAREHAAEVKRLAEEKRRALQADDDYLQSLIDERLQLGKTAAEVRIMEADRRAATAATNDNADAIMASARALEVERKALEDIEATKAARFSGLQSSAARGAIDFQRELDAINFSDDARRRLADGFRNTFTDGVTAALNGNLGRFMKGSLQSIASAGFSKAFDGLSGSLSKALSSIKLPGGLGGGIIGGVIGIGASLIGSLFGGSSKKKQEAEAARQKAAEEAEQARQAELQRLATVAANQRQIEIDMVRATKGDLAALAMEREDEIAAMRSLDPALATLKQSYFEAVDAAALAAKAQSELTAANEKAADINRGVYAAAMARVSEAQTALNAAYQEAAGRIGETRSKFLGLADGLRAAREALGGGAGSSATGFFATGALARLGDADAMARLSGMAGAQVDLVKATARNQIEEAKGIAAVRAELKAAEDTAARQVSIADQQLEALNKSVEGWMTLNASVLTIPQAINNLAAAFGVQARVQAGATGFYGVPQNVDVNKALEQATGYTGGFGQGGFQQYITGADPAYQAAARDILNAYGQGGRIVGFASGGMHSGGARIVGERGPELEVTGPSRIFSASQTKAMLGGDTSGLEAKLDAAIAELRAIKGDTGATAASTKDAAEVLEGAARGQLSLTTEAA